MKKSELVSKAHARYIRVSPRKIKQVIDLIRGEGINRALAILASLNKKAKVYAEKTLKSAIANARQDPNIKEDELFISRITADKGPMLKRYRAAPMGRATMIRHRTTHISVELAKNIAGAPKIKKKKNSRKRKVKS